VLEAAAVVALAGMSATEFLNETDSFKRNMTLLIAEKVMELQNRMDQNRAVMIANAVGKMLSGK
jgi:hypothetical protein